MLPDEIVECSVGAAEAGYRTVVLQSGEDSWFEAEVLAEVVREIKRRARVAVTLSIGERPEGEYVRLREAGADRFLLRMEVSSPIRYARFHPDSSWDERLECLEAVRTAHLQVGSGTLIGLPGHGVGTLSEDLLFLQSLELDMIGVGPFIPHPATPLAGERGGTLGAALRFLACLRLLCPLALIPATTAFAALDPSGWERGLRAGADVLMPNVTPLKYRDRYDLYPGKVWNRAEPAAFRREAAEMMGRLGRRVSDTLGHTRLRREAIGLESSASAGTVRS
jgi:biotin synthase